MTASSGDKKKTLLVVAACAVALAGLGAWAHKQQRRRIKEQRKLLTDLRFDLTVEEIQAETDAIIAQMKKVDDEIAATSESAVSFKSVAQKLIDLDAEMLARVTNVTFLGHVSPNKDIRDACTKADEAIEEFLVQRGMRADVYKVVKQLLASPEGQSINATKKRYVQRLVQDFERNGLQLDEAKQQDVQKWKQKLSKLGIQFHQNLTEETTELTFAPEELKGLSEDFIGSLEKGEDGNYKIALSYPTVFPILNTCSVPLTRKAVEAAFNRRCIDKNVAILEEMLQLRNDVATTLGYENHAAYVLEQRMAKSPSIVKNFLAELDAKLMPLAKKELDVLLKLKEEDGERNGWKFDGKFNMWDFRYYMDQYVKKYCSIDAEKIREFFPLQHVTNELLSMYQEILSLKFTEVSEPHVWHKDVRMFEVRDARKGREGKLVGHFYLDLFPRQGKYGHAACFTLQQSCVSSSGVRQLPAAAMVSNFNAPTKTKPSLLNHDEVVTYFHEFGHVMHCICSEVEIPRFAGTRVERDFVEAPSQMLENWCWETEPLKRLSSHYLDKTPLPDDLIAKLISTRNANTGLLNKRQILFATFDQQIHSKPQSDTAKVLKQLQTEIMLIDMTPGTNFAASFGHLAGGYDAQYYGYMWSEVFSMDMFVSRFQREGLMNPTTGLAYRELILARGGSIDAADMLKEFLGPTMPFEATVCSLPSNSVAFTNCVYVNFDDFMELVRQTPQRVVSKEDLKEYGLNIWINNKFVFAAKPQKEIARGSIAVGTMQRLCAGLPNGQPCQISPYVPSASKNVIASVTFEIQQVLTRAQPGDVKVIDCGLLKTAFESQYSHQVFGIGQAMAINADGLPLKLQCMSIDLVGDDSTKAPSQFGPTIGALLSGAIINFTKGKEAPVRLTNQSSGQSRSVFKPDFDFSKLGIGGLDKEFNDIFRRAFASRLFPTNVIQKLGIKHVRGMLLYGPPGCGKTLIARKISQALTAKEPKVVNGPEILDKFVGEAERKIRELFADARQEQQELGDESEVHIIIFDEIDAICKQRGSSRDSTGVGDSVVNQLLTQIDGVDSLNNVLVIGMTNRKDMLDEALMRPGRLEVQIEINLPDAKGRGQILMIHTERMRQEGTLSKEVMADLQSCLDPTQPASADPDYKNLVQRTKNFSGAELEGLVRAATAHALSRGTDGKTFHAMANFNPEVRMEDFDLALEEVKPKFGSPNDQLSLYYKNGLIPYGKSFTDVRESLVRIIEQVRSNDKTPLMSVLLHGERGSGKTALATYCAVASEFPLVRMVKASDLIGRAESAKCGFINTIFEEAYRSSLSIIILDDMERLMEYVQLGPRFSNLVLQALMVLVRNPVPVAGRKLIVIGITSNIDAMRALELADVFDISLQVPQLTKMEELDAVISHTNLPVRDEEKHQILQMMASQPLSVKKLLLITEMAREELALSGEDTISCTRFVECAYRFTTL
ncbi:TPA: hypothetical protein N0F65_003897 [Lagenidium giganteum]|uniref:AAA+ ATPase domain-containing protein n=1 Tax=Lagenidium giganteum TaxID=4803 RepID=A0AAV2ZCV0_9STRA|nr:TPA: hypothetical protein N0F65_003897 [Lagenidium giganteum]